MTLSEDPCDTSRAFMTETGMVLFEAVFALLLLVDFPGCFFSFFSVQLEGVVNQSFDMVAEEGDKGGEITC